MIITFCGHSKINIEDSVIEKIKDNIVEKIKANPDCKFYLGGYGEFDNAIFNILKALKKDFPKIEIIFISPYLEPNYSKLKDAKERYDDVIYPPIEDVPKRFAIIERNKWMISNADFVFAYVKYSFGGARKTLEYAIKKKVKYKNFAINKDD